MQVHIFYKNKSSLQIKINPLPQNRLHFNNPYKVQKKMIGLDQYSEKPTSNYHVKRFQEGISKLNPERLTRNDSAKQLQADLQKTLLTEIKKANQITEKFQQQQNKDKNNSTLIDDLREIEESIRRKNIVIKQLQNEVNYLKNGRQKGKYQNLNFSLTQQLRNYSIGIIELKKQLAEKRKLVNLKWQQLKQTKQKYIKKCKRQQKQVIQYPKFKEEQEKKRRDLIKLQKNRFNQNTKRYISSIWQDKKNQGFQYDKTNIKSQSIRQFLNRKNVAQGALKNERKKHKQQIISYESKLQFLKGQHLQLQEKIKTKQIQLSTAQKRFSESRNKLQPFLQRQKTTRKIQKFKTVQ